MLQNNNPDNIRNFSIIAHVNHGKSTLADRFLELTGTIKKEQMREQVLDQMPLERERGITIKMQPCTMEYNFQGKSFQLNLIDTPGHMDFAYEVERSLSAVEGVLLLVDVISGVQAQTLANLRLAKKQKLKLIPVINKIDICKDEEQLRKVKRELANLLEIREDKILAVSAKTGQNVQKVLETIIKEIPSPKIPAQETLRALVFDSFYDNYQGTIICLRIFKGQIKKGEKIYLLNQKKECQVREVGVFKPKMVPLEKIEAGRIGYLATGIKEVSEIRIGETVTTPEEAKKVKPLPGYREPKPLLFANLFPGATENFENLKKNLEKLRLNDASLNLKPISNPYLGRGLRAGFLGMLHLEITLERLKREHQTEVIVTSPSIVFKVRIKKREEPVLVHSAQEFPQEGEIEFIEEPWVQVTILTPQKYLNKIHQLLEQKRAKFLSSDFFDQETLLLKFQAPLSEIIEDFLDRLKSLSEGFASFSYEVLGWQKSDLVKLEFLVSRELKPSFSKILHQSRVQKEAEIFLKKLKEVLPPKNFSQTLQARIEGRIIAREDIRALRKDVTEPLYGGDFSRKKKLLEKQRKGKRRLEKEGKTPIPPDVYLKLICRS